MPESQILALETLQKVFAAAQSTLRAGTSNDVTTRSTAAVEMRWTQPGSVVPSMVMYSGRRCPCNYSLDPSSKYCASLPLDQILVTGTPS